MIKKGIDISEHNGNIVFDTVKKSGIEFAIIRSSYRTSTDKKFFDNVKGCIESGIEVLGTYHFLYGLNKQEVKKEAKLAVSNAKKAGLSKSIMIFADFEYDTIKQASEKGVSLGKKECIEHTLTFCKEVSRLGYRTGVYTNLDYYRTMYDLTVINAYPIWLADYSGNPDYTCMIQQYTSNGNIPGISGNVDLNYLFQNEVPSPLRSRNEVVKLVNSWVGKNEKDGSFKEIIDIYNSYSGSFPRMTKMLYSWAWCAATWSALAIKLGYTDIMPIEISCYFLIEAAKKMDCWVEDDSYIPSPGDAVLYDWEDNGIGDNTGVPDHIGVVTQVDLAGGVMTITEGNYDNAVKKRTISLNSKYIRGFIAPKYNDDSVITETTVSKEPEKKQLKAVANEVISGLWGNGENRKNALKASGYDPEMVQKEVNKILSDIKEQPDSGSITANDKAQHYMESIAAEYTATDDVYCRDGAGTNKRALCLIPKGTVVRNYGYFSTFNGSKWLYITFVLNGVCYTGFSCGKYLKR